MKGLTIDPIKETIIIEGHNFINDQEMPLDDFEQLCFENGWEGTLYKVRTAQMAFDKVLWNVLTKGGESNLC